MPVVVHWDSAQVDAPDDCPHPQDGPFSCQHRRPGVILSAGLRCQCVVWHQVRGTARSQGLLLSPLEMGADNMKVVADLTRHDPDEPDPDEREESDGTRGGAVSSEEQARAGAAIADATGQLVKMFWTLNIGWPVLNLQVLNPVDTTGVLLHLGIDLLKVITVYTCIVEDWLFNLIGSTGDKVEYINALIAEMYENVVNFVLITVFMDFALAGWVSVDTLMFADVSRAALVAAAVAATVLTCTFVATAYSLTATAIEIFGYPEAGVVWLMVLGGAISALLALLSGKLASVAGSIASKLIPRLIRIYEVLASMSGSHIAIDTSDLLCLSDPRFSWATLSFLLGTVASCPVQRLLLIPAGMVVTL